MSFKNSNSNLYSTFAGPPAPPPPQQARPASTQNVYQAYETTQSPIAYGSPSQQNTSSSVLNRIQKPPTNTSPTPAVQQATGNWPTIGRQVCVKSFDWIILPICSYMGMYKIRRLMYLDSSSNQYLVRATSILSRVHRDLQADLRILNWAVEPEHQQLNTMPLQQCLIIIQVIFCNIEQLLFNKGKK